MAVTIPDPLMYVESLYEVPDELKTELMTQATESAYRSVGMGSSTASWATFLTRIDKYGKAVVQLNREYRGMTFISRPRLNFVSRSLKQDRQMAMLNTYDNRGFPFAIRCLLDTQFAQSTAAIGPAMYCPFYNEQSAFNIPLSNALIGMTGWPDPALDFETSESGYFAEDQTIVRGMEDGRRTYDLQLTFRDFQGGFIMGMLFYWLRAMGLLAMGRMVPYTSYIDQWRLCYTVGIWRFVLDPSKNFIMKWAKATGCFPVSIPLGDCFNFSATDEYIPTSREFTVNFKANNVRYMDPLDLEAFVMLSAKYQNDAGVANSYKQIANTDIYKAAMGTTLSSDNTIVPDGATYNFTGLPTIDLKNGGLKLMYVAPKTELEDPVATTMQQIIDKANQTVADKITAANQVFSAAKSQSTSTLNTDSASTTYI